MSLLLCVAVLHRVDGKLLCVSRKDAPSKFCFPGGKVEPEDQAGSFDDTVVKAAMRELEEETGLKTNWTHCDLKFQTAQFGDKKCFTGLVIAREAWGALSPEKGTTIKFFDYEDYMKVCAFPGFYELAHKEGII